MKHRKKRRKIQTFVRTFVPAAVDAAPSKILIWHGFTAKLEYPPPPTGNNQVQKGNNQWRN
jgi:hypothetical protein